MAQRDPQAGGFLVAYDPRNTHARRVRLVVNVSSLVLVLLGSCWAVFFGFAHDPILLSALFDIPSADAPRSCIPISC